MLVKLKQFLISIPVISIILAKLYLLFNQEFKRQNLFFAKFISKDDLVFDIGACYGKKLASFVKLQAKVVAVEPQKKCLNFLKKAFSKSRVIFVQKAVGSKEGWADFWEGEDHSFSTMSKDWMTLTYHKWHHPYKVPVTTLDKLIEKYGTPSFIKIDVEGFELAVLRGLSRPIKMISIEFTRKNIGQTLEIINFLKKSGPNRYNLSVGDEFKFKFKTWKKPNEIIAYFKKDKIPSWGDVYVKREKNKK